MDHKYELIKACDKGVRLRRREEERDSAAIYRSKHLPETLFLPGRPVLKRKHAGFMKSGFYMKTAVQLVNPGKSTGDKTADRSNCNQTRLRQQTLQHLCRGGNALWFG